jgi:hypothetical protein
MIFKSKKSVRAPREDAGPAGFAKMFADEYQAMELAHRAHLHAFLGRAYYTYRLFQQFPGAYEQLKQDPFWRNSLQKPKDLTSSKHVLLFVMRAETPDDRALASKFAKIVDGFARGGVRASQVPRRVNALGGVEAAYQHFVAVEHESQSNGPSHTGLFAVKPVQRPVRPKLKRPPPRRKPKIRPWTGNSRFDK